MKTNTKPTIGTTITEKKLSELNKTQYEILAILYNGYGGEYAYNYKYLEYDTNLTRKELETEIKHLKQAGLVEALRGLMTEDGEVAGSGFTIPYARAKEAWQLMEDFKYTHL